MKKIIISTIILLTLSHGNVQIIASKNCELGLLSNKEVKKLFLLKKTLIEDQKVVVLDSMEATVYAQFIEQYLKKSSRKMRAYWVRMLFTGKLMPPPKVSLEELQSLGSDEQCHLSYIRLSVETPKNWKMLEVQ